MSINLNKYLVLARGNFDPMETSHVDSPEPEDPFVSRDRTIWDVDRKKVAKISDYHVKWADNETIDATGKPEDIHLTTHELAHDQNKNGKQEFVFVSGLSTDQIVAISMKDPLDKRLFKFRLENGQAASPHTLRFKDGEEGKLWVGLEYAGLIVKLDVETIMEKYKTDAEKAKDGTVFYSLTYKDFEESHDVRMQVGNDIPCPINTHPHGFCFDTRGNIWFTGKLTNTVGRLHIESGDVKHYELPTLEAVPIYLALDVDGNVWGTSLGNNTVYRVTTGAKEGQVEGEVFEIPITEVPLNRRPIKIVKDPQNRRYMWFSTESGHSVCRINLEKVDAAIEKRKEESQRGDTGIKSSTCVCSQGCRKAYKAPSDLKGILIEYRIPMSEKNMIGAALAFDKDHNLWFQSYYDIANGPASLKNIPPDYLIKINSRLVDDEFDYTSLEGIPIERFQIPSTGSLLHRLQKAPNGKDMFFTSVGLNRFGTIKFISDVAEHMKESEDKKVDTEPEKTKVAPSVSEDTKESEVVRDIETKEEEKGKKESKSAAIVSPPSPDAATNIREASEKASPNPIVVLKTAPVFSRNSNYIVEKIGSVFANSKIRVTWEFVEAVAAGEGVIATEKEHIVKMIWSKQSGKVSITVNGKVIVPEQTVLTRRNAPFIHRWESGSLRLQIIATPSSRQTMLGKNKYELEVNELRFADFKET